MRRYFVASQALLCLLLPCVARASDFAIDWKCYVLAGSLSQGATATYSGTIQMGSDKVAPTTANFVFPNAIVGGSTGISIGTIVIECDVFAPKAGPAIHDITIDLLGSILPGEFAKKPFIAWTELIKDIDNPNSPRVLVSDSGVAYATPYIKHYVFDKPTHAIRIKETFVLDGVTYVDSEGRTRIDTTALASLQLVEKELSFVPEPGQLAGSIVAFVSLAAVLRRRSNLTS